MRSVTTRIRRRDASRLGAGRDQRRAAPGGDVRRADEDAALAAGRMQVAGDAHAVGEEHLGRHDLLADVHDRRAARMEPAARAAGRAGPAAGPGSCRGRAGPR